MKYKGQTIMVTELYHLPNSNKNGFMKNLNLLMAKCKDFNLCFLCTDQNYDLTKMHLHNRIREFFAFILDNNWVPYILKPTHVPIAVALLLITSMSKQKQKSC